MILYSIIPSEIVFQNNGDGSAAPFLEMDYLGEKVQVTALENNRYRIDRVISTSPKAFLNPGLQPGTIIQGTF